MAKISVGGVENNREAARKVLPIERGDEIMYFIAQPVWSFEDFRERCPVPVNKSTVYTSNGKKPDPKDPQYLEDVSEYGRRRWGYTILKTLELSNLVIEGISLDDPTTWGNVEDTLKEEFGHFEFGQIARLVDEANSLDADLLEENRQTFFQRAAELARRSDSQQAEMASTNS